LKPQHRSADGEGSALEDDDAEDEEEEEEEEEEGEEEIDLADAQTEQLPLPFQALQPSASNAGFDVCSGATEQSQAINAAESALPDPPAAAGFNLQEALERCAVLRVACMSHYKLNRELQLPKDTVRDNRVLAMFLQYTIACDAADADWNPVWSLQDSSTSPIQRSDRHESLVSDASAICHDLGSGNQAPVPSRTDVVGSAANIWNEMTPPDSEGTSDSDEWKRLCEEALKPLRTPPKDVLRPQDINTFTVRLCSLWFSERKGSASNRVLEMIKGSEEVFEHPGPHSEDVTSMLASLAFHMYLVQTSYGVRRPATSADCLQLIGMGKASAFLRAHISSSRQPERFFEGLALLELCGVDTIQLLSDWLDSMRARRGPSIYPPVLKPVLLVDKKASTTSSPKKCQPEDITPVSHMYDVLLLYSLTRSQRPGYTPLQRTKAHVKWLAGLESVEPDELDAPPAAAAAAGPGSAALMWRSPREKRRRSPSASNSPRLRAPNASNLETPTAEEESDSDHAGTDAPNRRSGATGSRAGRRPAKKGRHSESGSQPMFDTESSAASDIGEVAAAAAAGYGGAAAAVNRTQLHAHIGAELLQGRDIQVLCLVDPLPSLLLLQESFLQRLYGLPTAPPRAPVCYFVDEDSRELQKHLHPWLSMNKVDAALKPTALTIQQAAIVNLPMTATGPQEAKQLLIEQSARAMSIDTSGLRVYVTPQGSPADMHRLLLSMHDMYSAQCHSQSADHPSGSSGFEFEADTMSMKQVALRKRIGYFKDFNARSFNKRNGSLLPDLDNKLASLRLLDPGQLQLDLTRTLPAARPGQLVYARLFYQKMLAHVAPGGDGAESAVTAATRAELPALYYPAQLAHRRCLLRLFSMPFEGVSSLYGYFKHVPLTHFNGHWEQLGLAFVHHQFSGVSEWVLVEPRHAPKLEKLAAEIYELYYLHGLPPEPNTAQQRNRAAKDHSQLGTEDPKLSRARMCSILGLALLHAGALYLPPELLRRQAIPYQKVELRAGHVLAAGGNWFHFGISSSAQPTLSIATNHATDEWLSHGGGLDFIEKFITFVQEMQSVVEEHRIEKLQSATASPVYSGLVGAPLPPVDQVLHRALERCPLNATCGLLRHLIVELGRLQRGKPTVCDYPTLFPLNAPSPQPPTIEQAEQLQPVQAVQQRCQVLLDRLHECRNFVKRFGSASSLCCCDEASVEHRWAEDEELIGAPLDTVAVPQSGADAAAAAATVADAAATSAPAAQVSCSTGVCPMDISDPESEFRKQQQSNENPASSAAPAAAAATAAGAADNSSALNVQDRAALHAFMRSSGFAQLGQAPQLSPQDCYNKRGFAFFPRGLDDESAAASLATDMHKSLDELRRVHFRQELGNKGSCQIFLDAPEDKETQSKIKKAHMTLTPQSPWTSEAASASASAAAAAAAPGRQRNGRGKGKKKNDKQALAAAPSSSLRARFENLAREQATASGMVPEDEVNKWRMFNAKVCDSPRCKRADRRADQHPIPEFSLRRG
jgi:hypothetical protein